ncbi:MAG TPA: ATP-binding protein, partial [Chitinophagaceae bacterium]|nr:ATP-binding protein [Chitinophagaceae bacterium]
GRMWVATSKGLYYRNDSLDSFISVGPEESIFRNSRVRSMVEDANKNIWGITSIGIFRYNPKNNELAIFGDKFGVFDVGTMSYAGTGITSKGELLFSNPHGYYKCFPNDVFNPLPPKILITDYRINGHSILPGKEGLLKGATEDANQITLKHHQNEISLDFAAIYFADPEKNTHQYILEGYESEWRDVREENEAHYFRVPPGRYVFRIRATSSYGVSAEKSIEIIVLPPWWQTWWAYTLYALLFMMSLWGFIKWRTRALKKEKIILEEKVTLRTKELKEEKEIVESTLNELKSAQAQLVQSEKMASLGELTAGIAHEIQNPLNFVNNFSEVNDELISELVDEVDKGNTDEVKAIANDIKQNLEKINHHGKRADAIVKGMLQHSRTSSGQREPTDINALTDEYLRLSYHGLRARDKSFQAKFESDFDNSIGKINIVSQDIGRVILNLINNAFYAVDEKKKQMPPSPKGEEGASSSKYEPVVTVTTKKLGPPLGDRGKIEIRVTDNGNGIPQKVLDKIFQPFFTTKPTGQGTGLGLSLSYDIVKAHGGELKVETKEGEGSEFVVQLPVQ